MKKYKRFKQRQESQHKEMLEKMSCYDNITGLPKISYLEELFSNNESNKYDEGTFLIVEIYDFNIISDNYGYDMGHELLKNIGCLLGNSTPEDSVICRGAGDGVIVFLPSLKDSQQMKTFFESVFRLFRKPLFVSGRSVYLDINIGASTYPDDGDNLLTVLRKADMALYKAKKKGTNKAVLYYDGLQEEVLRRIAIYNNLRGAINKNELEVYYQPQVETKSSKVVKFEALLRWKNEELGNVSPAEFIPISEETGLIIEIGEWVLRNVCRQIKAWMAKGYYYVVSINISQKEIQNEGFVTGIMNVLKEFDVPCNLIEIEVTESILMSSYEFNIETLRLIKSNGIGIALDDFGTGYSSLSYLKTLPIQTIKIDKSFVDDIVFDRLSRDIIGGIINLMKNLQLNVIVEGVESKEQVELLKDMGCSIIQGYYYSRPVPADVIESKYLGYYI